jgi:hypothetical protein
VDGVTASFAVDAVLAALGALFAIVFVGGRARRRRADAAAPADLSAAQ